MSEDLRLELSKTEMVENINNVILKYNLSLTYTEILLTKILEEVAKERKIKLENDVENYNKEMENDKNDNDKNNVY